MLSWGQSISLTPAQAATYKRAMGMTHERGPCCCACWRWHAFAGLSKELIADRRWSAAQVARLIDALDGCGGAPDNGQNNRMGMGMPS